MIRLLIIGVLFPFVVFAKQPESMVVVVSDEQILSLKGISSMEAYFNRTQGVFDVHSLDGVQAFENKFSKGLPSEPDEARKEVSRRYEDIGKKRMSELITKAYKAKMITLKYQLKKYPAIIFDKRYVVYGEFDLNKALNFYIAYEGGRK